MPAIPEGLAAALADRYRIEWEFTRVRDRRCSPGIRPRPGCHCEGAKPPQQSRGQTAGLLRPSPASQ